MLSVIIPASTTETKEAGESLHIDTPRTPTELSEAEVIELEQFLDAAWDKLHGAAHIAETKTMAPRARRKAA